MQKRLVTGSMPLRSSAGGPSARFRLSFQAESDSPLVLLRKRGTSHGGCWAAKMPEWS